MNYRWRQTAVSRWSDKNKNIWSEFLSCNINILGKRISSNRFRSWKWLHETDHRLIHHFIDSLQLWKDQVIEKTKTKTRKNCRKGRYRKNYRELLSRVWSFFVFFFFFFFFPCLTQKVASPFEAVECGPRWRCCRIDLVPTFALRGRRGTVFAGARVMSTSS